MKWSWSSVKLPSYLCYFKFFIFGREDFLIGLSGKCKFIYYFILLEEKKITHCKCQMM